MGKKRSQLYGFPYETVFQETQQALADAGFRINNVNPNHYVNPHGGLIKASAGVSWRSSGENIIVSVLRTETGTQVEMESREKAQLYDWGKGNQNIDKFFSALDGRLPPTKYGVGAVAAPVASAAQAWSSGLDKIGTFCMQCGTKLVPESKFCTKCGTKRP